MHATATAIRIGQVWASETGNRFRVVALIRTDGRLRQVVVERVNPSTRKRWDDGQPYFWHPDTFLSMRMEG